MKISSSIILFLIVVFNSATNVVFGIDFGFRLEKNYVDNLNLNPYTGLFIDEAPYEHPSMIRFQDFKNLEQTSELFESESTENKRYWTYNKLINTTDDAITGYLYFGLFDRVFVYSDIDSLILEEFKGTIYKTNTDKGESRLLYDLALNPGDSVEIVAFLSSGIIRNNPISSIDVTFVPIQNRLAFINSQSADIYKSTLHIGLLFLIGFLIFGCLILYALSREVSFLLFIGVSFSLFVFYIRNLEGYYEQIIFWCHWPEALFQFENFLRTGIALSFTLFVFKVFTINKYKKIAIKSSVFVLLFSFFAGMVRYDSVGPFIHVTPFAKSVYFLDLILIAVNSLFIIILVWISKEPYARRFVLAIGIFIFLSYIGMSLNHTWLGQLDSLLSSKLYSTYGAMFFIISVGYITIKKVYQTKLDLKSESLKSQELEELDRNRSRMLTNITHELRAPLTIINGVAEDMKAMPLKGELIKKSSDNLLSLVDGLLDYSKYETAEISKKLIQGNIVSYLNYLTESFLSLAENKDIQVNFVSEEACVLMDYDETIIRLIALNLLSNSLKFTQKGGSVNVHLHQDAGFLIWKVNDNGIGIAENDVHKIFDRFYQSSNNPSDVPKGSGIGLALVKELVSLIDGSINVISKLGVGSEFVVKIPISNTAPIEADGQMAGNDSISLPTSECDNIESMLEIVVLIVEDNQGVRDYIESVVGEKYRVISATNGREGFDLAVNTLPDLVISDVVMPLLDGNELTIKLKKNPITEHIPVVLLTGRNSQEEKEKGLLSGADAFVAKPFSKLELLTRVDNLVQLRKTLHDKYNTTEDIIEEKVSPWLFDFTEVVMQNLEKDIRVDLLCKSMLMSRTQLHRKITAVTGESAMSYVKKIKLKRSKEMITSSDMSISEIADKVGYKNAAHFSKDFKKFAEVSPSEFRAKVL